MIKIKNPRDIIVGRTYKITFPCYDDYNEGLEPEINVVTVSSKTKHSVIANCMNSDSTYELKYHILTDCEIYEI